MDIVVVLEPDTPSNIRILASTHPAQPVLRAHTAPTEPSGLCGPVTLCGLDTADMTLAPHWTDSGARRWHTCGPCQNSFTTPTGDAGAPATTSTPDDA
ncbi:hypothetical protein ACGFX4_04700 [Kitasatospora sp. NPDC048365]|uniref:hypothetical protein n=1 Tax=Kitasatospora sp. NPDC048365 TaxID=3364050 RepID=UPI0037121D7D